MLSSVSELDMIKNIPNYSEIKTIIDNVQISVSDLSGVSNEAVETLSNETIINTSVEMPINNNVQTVSFNDSEISVGEVEQPKLNENIQSINAVNMSDEGVNDVETL